MPVGLVLVAHVAELAEGVRVLAAQMAPGVAIAAAGGTDEGGDRHQLRQGAGRRTGRSTTATGSRSCTTSAARR